MGVKVGGGGCGGGGGGGVEKGGWIDASGGGGRGEPQGQIPRGRRDDMGGGGERSIKEMGFGVDCLWGAGTIVDCLVSRGGFRPRGTRYAYAIGARHRRTFSTFSTFMLARRE